MASLSFFQTSCPQRILPCAFANHNGEAAAAAQEKNVASKVCACVFVSGWTVFVNAPNCKKVALNVQGCGLGGASVRPLQ